MLHVSYIRKSSLKNMHSEQMCIQACLETEPGSSRVAAKCATLLTPFHTYMLNVYFSDPTCYHDNLFVKRKAATVRFGKNQIQEDLWNALLTWGIPYKIVINKVISV